ncbi:MAG: hypothetical protein AAFY15_11705, partial [Cyanobacteria bacterium J06648_11]
MRTCTHTSMDRDRGQNSWLYPTRRGEKAEHPTQLARFPKHVRVASETGYVASRQSSVCPTEFAARHRDFYRLSTIDFQLSTFN